MSMRVAVPFSLRTVGLAATLGGALITFFSGFTGRGAIAGAVVLCAGIAVLDGVDRGGLGLRQAGLFLVLLGFGLGAWSFVVLTLLALIRLPADEPVLIMFVSSTAAVLVGAQMIRPPAPLVWVARAIAGAARRAAPPVRRAAASLSPRHLGRAAG
jgi:hypothetical protein